MYIESLQTLFGAEITRRIHPPVGRQVLIEGEF